MATSEQKQELIDTIKRPIRYYRLRLYGYGGEIVYGKSSKEEYDYWETDIEERRKEFNIPEDESPFNRYMMDKDDTGCMTFSDVPESLWREDEWYDQDDIEHGNGVAFDNARIEIIELDDDSTEANEIQTILNEDLPEVVDSTDIELIIGDSDVDEDAYVFYAMSVEKGVFFDSIIEVDGKIDIAKLKFICTEYPNGDTLVDYVQYNGEELENFGGDTNGKALYIELVDL